MIVALYVVSAANFEDTNGLQLTETLLIPSVEDAADVTGFAP